MDNMYFYKEKIATKWRFFLAYNIYLAASFLYVSYLSLAAFSASW